MSIQIDPQAPLSKELESVIDPDDKISCPLCRESINPRARICIHCRSDLTWRRYLPIGSTSLAIITAMIAVSAAVAPGIKRLFEVQDSALHATFLAEDWHHELAFLVANNGNRPGFVKSAEIEYAWGKSQDETLRMAFQRKRDGSFLVSPNSATQINLEYYDEQNFRDSLAVAKSKFQRNDRALFESMLDIDTERRPAVLSKQCKIVVEFVNSSGSTNETTLTVECVKLLVIMQDVLRNFNPTEFK